ncbi:hypothetical protein ElyMa_006417100 [Elysia marginata]|uniref:Uncharacterized protein n=1 Tax=Elysia marginata TaxID=1093978 RepID=A0AAV4HTX3_9GAST|nr:hypothetical protein ElyMa_006417100 [Elysia marginata]
MAGSSLVDHRGSHWTVVSWSVRPACDDHRMPGVETAEVSDRLTPPRVDFHIALDCFLCKRKNTHTPTLTPRPSLNKKGNSELANAQKKTLSGTFPDTRRKQKATVANLINRKQQVPNRPVVIWPS